ncbi:hypothetical protein D3C75_589700 [compost metagenome]
MSIARAGTVGYIESEVKSAREERYEPAKILPISLSAESSISPSSSSLDSSMPAIRLSKFIAASGDRMKNRLPGASPSTRRNTAYTSSSAPPTLSVISSKLRSCTLGTAISIGLFKSCDNAVAAFPAPMFPTSLSTSILKSL